MCSSEWLTHPFETKKNGSVFESVLITYFKISVHNARFWKAESRFTYFLDETEENIEIEKSVSTCSVDFGIVFVSLCFGK